MSNYAEYGELEVEFVTNVVEGKPKRTTLQTNRCSDEQIALPGEASDGKAFFTVANPEMIDLNTENRAKLQCISDDYQVYGRDSKATSFSVLDVTFKSCKN